jgi:hypothetical protein
VARARHDRQQTKDINAGFRSLAVMITGAATLVVGWRASRGHPSGSGPSLAGPTRASVHEWDDTPPLRVTPVPSGTVVGEAQPNATEIGG